jgi:hypothetical protein
MLSHARVQRCLLHLDRLMQSIPIRAVVTEVENDEMKRVWIRVELNVPADCERIEVAVEELGPSVYAPPLLDLEPGPVCVWLTSLERGAPDVGSGITAYSFIRSEQALK